jgi:hypothetical protein
MASVSEGEIKADRGSGQALQLKNVGNAESLQEGGERSVRASVFGDVGVAILANQLAEAPGIHRFLHEIEDAECGGGVAVFGQPGSGDDDDSCCGVLCDQIRNQIDAAAVGQLDVQDAEVDMVGFEEEPGFEEGLGAMNRAVGKL